MQIKSINTEHTTDIRHVAFNLDEDPPDLEVVQRIAVGTLKFHLKDKCLVVTVPNEGITSLGKNSITAINQAIATAQQKLTEELNHHLQKRAQMFDDLSRNTGLILDTK